MSRERPAQHPRAWAARAPRPHPSRRLSWERTVLATQNPRKPTEENAPSLPTAPPLRTAPGADGARPPPTTPDGETSGCEDAAPPPQSLFANQDTDSVFNFAMGRVGRGRGAGGPAPLSPPWLCRSRAKPLPCTLCFRLLLYIIYFPLFFFCLYLRYI